MRMLSLSMSSPSTQSTNPNPRISPAVKAASPILKPSRDLMFPVPAKIYLPQSQCQSMTFSRCFSGLTNSFTVSAMPETETINQGIDSDSQLLIVVSFYKFADFPDHARMRIPLKELCEELVLFISIFVVLFPLYVLSDVGSE